MGLGVVGLEPDRLAVGGDGLGQPSPGRRRALPRLLWAAAWSGLSRIASRKSAMASVELPLASQGDAEVGSGPRRSRA